MDKQLQPLGGKCCLIKSVTNTSNFCVCVFNKFPTANICARTHTRPEHSHAQDHRDHRRSDGLRLGDLGTNFFHRVVELCFFPQGNPTTQEPSHTTLDSMSSCRVLFFEFAQWPGLKMGIVGIMPLEHPSRSPRTLS